MTDHDARAAGLPPDPQTLAESLREVAVAFDQARASGLSVSVPEPLYFACLDIIHRHDLPDGPPPGDGRPVPSAAPNRGPSVRPEPLSERVNMQDVPLRRLVWQVIDPGEEFTVAEITARLARLGAPRPTTAVSNALGYWASRERLTRVRKGTYCYPRPSSPPSPANKPNDQRQESPSASTDRADEARGEEYGHGTRSRTRRKAAS